MTRKKALERWETKIVKTKARLQAMWHIAMSLINKDGTRAWILRLKFHPLDEANVISDYLENRFQLHDLCDGSYNCGIDGIPNECLRQLPRSLVHTRTTNMINECIWLSHFPTSWKEAKAIALPKPRRDSKFPQNLRPNSLLSTTGKRFEKLF
jgi:hypothetical protein